MPALFMRPQDTRAHHHVAVSLSPKRRIGGMSSLVHGRESSAKPEGLDLCRNSHVVLGRIARDPGCAPFWSHLPEFLEKTVLCLYQL